jgi:hypothetical protein
LSPTTEMTCRALSILPAKHTKINSSVDLDCVRSARSTRQYLSILAEQAGSVQGIQIVQEPNAAPMIRNSRGCSPRRMKPVLGYRACTLPRARPLPAAPHNEVAQPFCLSRPPAMAPYQAAAAPSSAAAPAMKANRTPLARALLMFSRALAIAASTRFSASGPLRPV